MFAIFLFLAQAKIKTPMMIAIMTIINALEFFIYFILPPALFWLVAILLFLIAAALAFVTINGTPLLNVALGLIGFSIGGKDYTWKKKESPYPFKPIRRTAIKKIEQGPVLQAQSSQLKRIRTAVELKTK